MSKFLIVMLLLILSGCSLGTEYACKDGVVYFKSGGIWLEAKTWSENKCFSVGEPK